VFLVPVIECVPDTISIDSLKRNDPDFTDLKSFFAQHFGSQGSNVLHDAKANFVESLAVSDETKHDSFNAYIACWSD
jgi:hypothetical protein